MSLEQHAVPQNVTSFQFRLVGDMTLKQVGYLAVGGILSYIFFKSPLPIFLSWPIGLTSLLTGIGFAFVPIENRPMDVWVLSFIKQIYYPTVYVWGKEDVQTKAAHASSVFPMISSLLPTFASVQKPATPQQSNPTKNTDRSSSRKSSQPFSQIASMLSLKKGSAPGHIKTQEPVASRPNPTLPPQPLPISAPVQPPTTPKEPLTTPAFFPPAAKHQDVPEQKGIEQDKADETGKTAQTDNKELHDLMEKIRKLEQDAVEQAKIKQELLVLQTQLSQSLSDKKRAEDEAVLLRKQIESTRSVPTTYQHAGTVDAARQPTVRIIPPDMTKKSGIPKMTSIPNVITGIVKDDQNSMLPEILITIRDKEDIPLRALKTNRLGQFAASTPLQNGVYVVEVEDPRKRFTFDRAQIPLNGGVLPPIEIRAKSKKQVDRAKLEAQIFGNQNNV